jgi:propanol-preferring alcohol dehydrogenase
VVAPADFVYPLPQALDDHQVAPLLCAGIIGYRCLRQCGIEDWSGAKLGLYGFGAAGHIAIQIARHRGADVYVCTRDRDRHQTLAEELGAAWVGGTVDPPPAKLDASIIFAPAGEIIPPALEALDRGGTLVCGGIYMSPTPPIEYPLLYQERVIRSVANNTRADGREFLAEAANANVQTHTQRFPLEEANEALIALKHDAIRGEAVLDVT